METLRLKYNVKTSPIDYMKSQTLRFIDAMLQEIALQFTNKSEYSINEVRYIAKEKAKLPVQNSLDTVLRPNFNC